MDLYSPNISRIIDDWIEEDIGKGDLTSSAITQKIGKAHWIAKEEGIFCGVGIIKEILKKIAARTTAKQKGDFKLADQIRDELLNKGIIIEDLKDKTIWKYK